MQARLQSKLWVDAHIRFCFTADLPCFILHKGDSERGGILLKINRFDAGILLLESGSDFDGNRIWRRLGGENPSEAEADECISKKRQYDADLWVLEIEDMRAVYEADAPIDLI